MQKWSTGLKSQSLHVMFDWANILNCYWVAQIPPLYSSPFSQLCYMAKRSRSNIRFSQARLEMQLIAHDLHYR